MNQERRLITFVKYPEKGKVKSRLVLGDDDGHVADLYHCFIEDLLERVSSTDYRFLIAFDPPEKEKDFAELFGKDFSYVPQSGEDLGMRMYNAFSSCFAEGFQSVALIGSDSPDLPREIIEEAFESLDSYEAVIGPTYDGGYYLIGFSKDAFSEVFFENMTWSTDSVYTETIRRFDQEGISFHVLPRWGDIDTVNDLKALLKDCEHSDFSRSKTVKFLKDKGFAKEIMGKKISIIIPVLNESEGINNTVKHLNVLITSTGVSAEIIVIDGDPEGKTIAAIKNKSVITAVGKTGRASQMNKGAQLANGEIFLFLHADTRLPDDGLNLIIGSCDGKTTKAGAFNLAIASERKVFRLIETMANVRSHMTGIPYGDQGLFFNADYFRALGGFADMPIMEDVEIIRRMKKRGDNIVFLKDTVQTSPRRWQKEGVWKCTLRNWSLVSLFVAGVKPQRLAKCYRVHEADKTA